MMWALLSSRKLEVEICSSVRGRTLGIIIIERGFKGMQIGEWVGKQRVEGLGHSLGSPNIKSDN